MAVAFALALLVDVSKGLTESAQAWTGQDVWTVTRWRRAGATYVLSAREGKRDWSPGQACGAPDTPGGGDRVTAWASATQDGQEEWLTLEFADAVVPQSVRVYENYGTGALVKVCVFTAGGDEVEAWTGSDPTPRGRPWGVSQVPLNVSLPTKRVKLYLDSARVPSWNEVDAVGLVDGNGREQWAVAAEASSVYGVGSASPVDLGGPAALAPPWGGLHQLAATPLSSSARAGSARAAEARGWPMLTLWSNVNPTTPTTQAPAPTGLAVALTGRRPAWNTVAIPAGGTLISGAPAPAVGGPVAGRASLPVRPIWDGFAVNTLFYAVVLFLLYWALTVPLRFVREVSRVRRGCCVACGYDLGYDFVPGCPECGWRRGGAPIRPRIEL